MNTQIGSSINRARRSFAAFAGAKGDYGVFLPQMDDDKRECKFRFSFVSIGVNSWFLLHAVIPFFITTWQQNL